MSVVIQKKKFKNHGPQLHEVLQYNNHNTMCVQYYETLENFEVAFKKACCQSSQKQIRTTLESFFNLIKDDQLFLSDLSKRGDTGPYTPETFFLTDKALKIVNLVADYLVFKRTKTAQNFWSFDFLEKAWSDTKKITLLCLRIIRLISFINISIALCLAGKLPFIKKINELLLQDKKMYFKQILGIQEAVIVARPDLIDQIFYPDIVLAINFMSRKHFARYARIIALSMLEGSEKTKDLRELSPFYTENRVIKIHTALLQIPNLVENYIIVLENLKNIAQKLMFLETENPQLSLKFLKDSDQMKDSGLDLSFLKPLFERTQISDRLMEEIFCPKFVVKFIVKKSTLTEILFIISNLLSGKRKFEVQAKLCQIKFIERVLDPVFDLLFNDNVDGAGDDPPYGYSSSYNSPLATARIQLLRTIINFCESDSPNIELKDELLTLEEKKVLYFHLIQDGLKAHCPHASDYEVLLTKTKELSEIIPQMCLKERLRSRPFFIQEKLKENAFRSVSKKGLMHKIILLFSRYDPNSNYRFWVASCVEAFLKGSYEPHQIFIAHTGLFYALMNENLNRKINRINNIQISYDLMGEIVKFSKYNMIFLEKLCETFNWTNLISEQISSNIIDSNVFLRAMVLSFERFAYIAQKKTNAKLKDRILDLQTNSKIYELFVKDISKSFQSIAHSMAPLCINQENICCVNTLLVFAIFADQKGELETYIDLIAGPESGSDMRLVSFSEILRVWHKFYISKSKDSFSLEYTTSLPFYYFNYVQQKMLNIVEIKLKSYEIRE